MLRSLALFLVACNNCPEGYSKEAGQCVPDNASPGTSDQPLSEENFQRRFSIRLCQEFERCLDEGFDSNYWEVDCEDPVEWDDECPFDLQAAERCLDEDWPCSLNVLSLQVTYGPSCDDVYDCGE
jgi:hypothetical protein